MDFKLVTSTFQSLTQNMQIMKYLVASSAVVILFLIYIRTYLRSVYLALKLPGPKALPIIGNVLFLNDDREMEHLGNKAHELYGSFMRFWVSFLPCIVVHEPRHLNIILGTNRYSRKNIFYTLLHNFLGQGLITNNGYAWKKNRKMIQSLFHTNIQEIFIETFQDCAEAFVSKLNGLTDVKITALVNDCVLDILHNAILGVPLDKNSPYRKGQVILNDRLTKPWLLLETIFSRTTSAQKEIEQKTNLHSYTKKCMSMRTSTFAQKLLLGDYVFSFPGYQFALMEMKTIIFTILKKYELSLVPGHEEYTLTYRTTLRAKGGIWIRLKARK
nr:probable cytochrome P450 4aa1 [Leptinotarsa decemlineata]